MKVWILQTGEPLQIDTDGLRPMRAMNLSKALIDRGHHVTLWSSDFDHFSKKHRYGSEKTIQFSNQLTIRLIESSGYESNIGLSRLLDHFQLGWNLWKMIKKEEVPDIAFIGYPPIEPAWVMAKFLKKKSIPSILDVKDAWPEVLVRGLPSRLRVFAKFLLAPYFIAMKSTFKSSSHLSSISPDFLDWALSVAGRKSTIHDRVNFLTAFPQRANQSEISLAEKYWDSLEVKDDGKFRTSYIGTISSVISFERVIEAARATDSQFVIAGDGSAASQFKEAATGIPNIIFPGWISVAQASVLSKRTSVMIAPYKDLDDFSISLPNKFIDAMSHGKPMLSSISGYAQRFLEENQIGKSYSNDRVHSLTRIIEDLNDNMQNVSDMGSRALNLFENQYSGEIVYLELSQVLETIVAETQP